MNNKKEKILTSENVYFDCRLFEKPQQKSYNPEKLMYNFETIAFNVTGRPTKTFIRFPDGYIQQTELFKVNK